MAKAMIEERGNGFPSVGDYVQGNDSQLYLIESIDSRIQTGEQGSGRPNYLYATVELADWSDCDEADEHTAVAVLLEEVSR